MGAPRAYIKDPLHQIATLGTSHIALVPYAFTGKSSNKVVFDHPRQWWGETTAGVIETIRLAKKQNLRVMLKPQVYMHHQWTGDLEFDNERDWVEWESNYKKYILHMAKVAQTHDLELFCLGTEFKKSVEMRCNFWIQLIEEVRKIYHGKLTYSANWDNYSNIGFWDQLDLIGISAYFPLSTDLTPSAKDLSRAWQPIKMALKDFSNVHDKQILFTEFGYLSVDGCADATWKLEDKIHELQVNEAAQANAINAILQCFSSEAFWAGGFLWKWFPNGHGHEGYFEKDYTPQGKLAEKILTDWFKS